MPDDHLRDLIEAFLREMKRVYEQAKGRKATPDDVKALDETLKNLRDELGHALKHLCS